VTGPESGADRGGARTRVLLVSADTVGPAMAGPAIRYWEFARALSRDTEVILAAPNSPGVTGEGFRVVQHGRRRLHRLVRWCDVVVSQGFGLPITALGLTRKVIVVDLYDPLPLELLEHYDGMPARDARFPQRLVAERLNALIRVGDLFLCTGDRQRDFWLGMLAAGGRLNWHTYRDDPLLRRLITVVPFGLPSEPPERRGPGLRGRWPGLRESDRILLWGGGVWDWLDPLTVIRAVGRVAAERGDLKLVFMGVQHPNPEIPRMKMLAEAESLTRALGLYERHVFFNRGWVPYQERQGALLDADAGVSAHPDHIEGRFAFRTRLLDYFWAGLPVLCTQGDDLSEAVQARGAGLVLKPGDVDGWTAAIHRLLDDPGAVGGWRAASRALAAELTWERLVAPLREFCRAPGPAPDRVVRSRLADLAKVAAYLGRVGWTGARHAGARRIWGRLRAR
jgi:glycosyltransferase involved in cell wall biosynthesis